MGIESEITNQEASGSRSRYESPEQPDQDQQARKKEYEHYLTLLKRPRKDLSESERLMIDFLKHRIGKIEFHDVIRKEGVLMFSQAIQTHLTKEVMEVMDSIATRAFKPPQVDRQVQTIFHKTKLYGLHIQDFGTTVDEAQIKKEFALLEIEEKNLRLLYGNKSERSKERSKNSVSPKRQKKQEG